MTKHFTPDNLPFYEEEVLSFWKENNSFQKSLDNRKGCPEWVFYDGPPFANGLPHYGHLLTGYTKDTFNRYQTMKGNYVPRQFGWDTHGLPAELEAMKQLGLKERSDVLEMGVTAFNNEAKSSVLRYVDEWKEYVDRQGRWVDFDNGYKTLDLNYMESVLWAFKQLYDKNLAYESYRVLPYCWKDETPLSTHELGMDDDVYRTRKDTSATVKFKLFGTKAATLGLENVYALAWTTTPWTLPMNMALAVNPSMTYTLVKKNDELLLLAEDQLDNHFEEVEVVSTFTGSELVGLTYSPLWDYYTDTEKWKTDKAWTVLEADFVTADSGTGLVHLAPSHGEEDQKVSEANGLPTFLSVDDSAHFLPAVTDFAGQHVFDSVDNVLANLGKRNLVFSTEEYSHEYPHCWRCGNPLVYKAVSSWFVKTTQLRSRMLELNEEVNWYPEHVKHGSFHNWLDNTRDWSVSRNRFWGTPVPVWKSDNPEYPRVDVYGSVAELESDFGVEVTDLHRPLVDDLVRSNPDDPSGKSMMRRVEDVLDVWFDSGSMPFAQFHYPFDNKQTFEEHHPADFVVEYLGQTRGWFYVLHVLSTALFDRPAYKNVVAHGVVLGSDGLKMSKKKGNYPNVNELFDKYGSDATRWFLLSSPVLRGQNLAVTDEAVEKSARDVLLPLLNLRNFFTSYWNGKAPEEKASTHMLDVYVQSKLQNTVKRVTECLDKFDTASACLALSEFVEGLSNWYVRRSRTRFAQNDGAALSTLYSVLETLYRLAAPLLPMTAEKLWKELTDKESVHYENYPVSNTDKVNPSNEEYMDKVRELSSLGLAVRKKNMVRVRQPLKAVTVFDNALPGEYEALLLDELNVRSALYSQASPLNSREKLVLNYKLVGKRLGKQAQVVFAAAKQDNWKEAAGVVTVGDTKLLPEEYSKELYHEKLDSSYSEFGKLQLDLTLDEELLAEGFVRDMMRAVQDERKAQGFHLEDKVKLAFYFDRVEDKFMFEKKKHLFVEETNTVCVETVDTCPDEKVTDLKPGAYVNKGNVYFTLNK